MDENVCGADRAVRLVLGTVLLAWALATPTDGDGGLRDLGHHLALGFGLEFLVTGLTQRCPGNRLLGINTC